MKRKLYLGGGLLACSLFIVWFLSGGSSDESANIQSVVKKGRFDVVVTTTGELSAKTSENINGPEGLRNTRIYQVKITDLVPEGTLVQPGDYVATLDRSEVEARLKDVESEYQKNESQYTKTRLDTTMQLRTARNELINMKFSLEEKRIVLEQSKYEPPATIRQAQIDLDKAKRSYDQAVKDYDLKQQQAVALMQEVKATFSKITRRRQELMDVIDQFEIHAPKSGMVIYYKEWNGNKRKVGSQISPWDPTVATLPDLSSMVSKTYVNEIDISKVKKGQKVKVGVDAFPDRKYNGEVIEIANVGEQLSGSDAKVFEVVIQVHESDSILRPGMTTANTIYTASHEDVLYVPLEALHANDSLSYVYCKDGFSFVKQIVVPGISNENEVIITQGLQEGEQVLLNRPDGAEDLDYQGLELVGTINRN
jgi:multidrug efflux pump subunit AcrA (membrane-fusion protein)